jgi:hypothetical protein
LDRASELGRVLFTQDDDSLTEATHRQQRGPLFGGRLATAFVTWNF